MLKKNEFYNELEEALGTEILHEEHDYEIDK